MWDLVVRGLDVLLCPSEEAVELLLRSGSRGQSMRVPFHESLPSYLIAGWQAPRSYGA